MRNAKRKTVLTASMFFVMTLSLTMMATPVHAITWGQEDTGNDYENVGTIVYWHVQRAEWRLLCSGTLIYEGDGTAGGVFLTAAHCTDDLEMAMNEGLIGDVAVSFDPMDPLDQTTFHMVSEVHTHPDYDLNTISNDVGILILDNAVAGIEPAALAEPGFLDQLRREGALRPSGSTGAYFTVAGYGGTLTWPPPEFDYPDTRSFAQSQFQALLKTELVLSQNIARDNGGTCFGDSGGPVFWEDNDDRILVALTSWGDPNCVAIGFYCRVDIPDTWNFIVSFLPQ
jgi:hypothetical protein